MQKTLTRSIYNIQAGWCHPPGGRKHVDRSILSPLDFVYTNVIGTVNLLNTAKKYWDADPTGKTILSCFNR